MIFKSVDSGVHRNDETKKGCVIPAKAGFQQMISDLIEMNRQKSNVSYQLKLVSRKNICIKLIPVLIGKTNKTKINEKTS